MSGIIVTPAYPLRIVTGTVMASLDRQAIEERGVSGLWLMEKAGEGVTAGLLSELTSEQLRRTAVVCGKGNNGGDGLVIARRLMGLGYSPRVALIGTGEELQGDARTNSRQAIDLGIRIHECRTSKDMEEFFAQSGTKVYIDALLGTGAKGAPKGLIAEAIHALNRVGKHGWIVSVDIPSGVNADTGQVEGEAVLADSVYTLGLPKVGLLVPPGMDYCRRLRVLDIGFPGDLMRTVNSDAELLTDGLVESWLPLRGLSAHKGSEGHLLIVAGSRGMTGAALMCARAAIGMGAGLVTAACPGSLLPIYAGGVWEMLTLPVDETPEGSFSEQAFETVFRNEGKYTAVVIGPGLGRNPATQEFVRRTVREVKAPILIDGDGLTALTPDALADRNFPWVATPHPGEMARLFGVRSSDVQSDRWDFARRLAGSGPGVAVLKGAKTVIAAPGRSLYVNPTGSPAMASGGMGDVLAGMIGSLLAKGIPPVEAAAVGVYLHGLASDLIVEETGAEVTPATEVISKIQHAVARVRRNIKEIRD